MSSTSPRTASKPVHVADVTHCTFRMVGSQFGWSSQQVAPLKRESVLNGGAADTTVNDSSRILFLQDFRTGVVEQHSYATNETTHLVNISLTLPIQPFSDFACLFFSFSSIISLPGHCLSAAGRVIAVRKARLTTFVLLLMEGGLCVLAPHGIFELRCIVPVSIQDRAEGGD
ncbi:Mannan polymerase complexes subunit [Venturia inaequalis]|nr:Mannan polymerase complexes subunit [Venturia inaequalis]